MLGWCQAVTTLIGPLECYSDSDSLPSHLPRWALFSNCWAGWLCIKMFTLYVSPVTKLPTCPQFPLCRPMTARRGFRWQWPQTVVFEVEFNSSLKQQQKPATIQNAAGPSFPERYKAHLYIWNRNLCSRAKCLKGSREKQAHLSLDLVLDIFEGSCFLCSYIMVWTTCCGIPNFPGSQTNIGPNHSYVNVQKTFYAKFNAG